MLVFCFERHLFDISNRFRCWCQQCFLREVSTMKMIEGSDLKTNRFLQSCLQKVMSVLYRQNCCMKGLDEPLPASLPNRMLVSCHKRGENDQNEPFPLPSALFPFKAELPVPGERRLPVLALPDPGERMLPRVLARSG